MATLEQVNNKNRKQTKDWLKNVIDGALDAVFPDGHNKEDSRTYDGQINDIPTRLLAFQLGLAGFRPSLMGFTGRAADDWPAGYVWSFKAAFIQSSGGGAPMWMVSLAWP